MENPYLLSLCSLGSLWLTHQRFILEGNGARFGLLPMGKFRAIHSGWRRAEEGARGRPRGMTG
jgi:hypothetical protein